MATYVFPEDLTSSQYGHWMLITALGRSSNYASPTGAGQNVINNVIGGINTLTGLAGQLGINVPQIDFNAGFNTILGNVALFIPGEGINSGLAWSDQHEYQDIRLSNIPGGILGGEAGGIGALVTGLAGRQINPGVQVLFRTTKLRQFEFSFLMAPQSEYESKQIEAIIKFLRSNAAPEEDGIMFKTPSEFEIDFLQGRNPAKLPKIGRCVLENITTYYSPQGEWSTFSNGYPVAVFLQLTFREMQIMTKQKIDAGY